MTGETATMDMRTYQECARKTDQTSRTAAGEVAGPEMVIPLLGLAGEVGELLSEYKKYLRDGESHKLFSERISEELGDLLWYVSNVATKFGLDLGEIAAQNLAKCRDRWGDPAHPSRASGTQSFDHGYSDGERLPRRFIVDITTVHVEGRARMKAFVNGEQLGDDLTDNAYSSDGYRYHDVFHLAYAGVLGWSPIIRSTLKRKRRSDPRVDEVEDGGRAKAIEEGISAMVFSYAADHNFLDGAEGVSYDLLRTIKSMTSHLEVCRCSAGEWEKAIMDGFIVWRVINERGSGSIEVNLDQKTIRLYRSVESTTA
jgi:NTP pyrophosphatase (non-canonical NTP hydrolase)